MKRHDLIRTAAAFLLVNNTRLNSETAYCLTEKLVLELEGHALALGSSITYAATSPSGTLKFEITSDLEYFVHDRGFDKV